MAPKKFTIAKPTHEPIPFEVDYQEKVWVEPDGADAGWEWQPRTAAFTTLEQPSAGALLEFARWIGGTTIPIEALESWFNACLPDTEFVRLQALINDKTVQVPIEFLGDLAMWLAEQFGQRPTLPSAPSANGSSMPGGGPTEQQPSEASTS